MGLIEILPVGLCRAVELEKLDFLWKLHQVYTKRENESNPFLARKQCIQHVRQSINYYKKAQLLDHHLLRASVGKADKPIWSHDVFVENKILLCRSVITELDVDPIPQKQVDAYGAVLNIPHTHSSARECDRTGDTLSSEC